MISRSLRGVFLASALLALTGCAAFDTRPAVCRLQRGDGIGGTGIQSDVLLRLVAADRGMGGTGISDHRGMGGTGVVAQNGNRGMGGTGIIGVVTGFGSICVNGYEIEMADSTAVTVENLPAAAADIKLGQVVEIEAFKPDGKLPAKNLTAASVNVRMAVAGPVSSVGPDGTTAVIAGQTVRKSALSRAAQFNVGQWVAVSGLRRGDDVVIATSIETLPQAGREVLVAGPVRMDLDGRRRIGGLMVAASQLTAGQTAVVRGSGQGATFVASAVRTELPPDFTTRVATLSVEGFATAMDAGQIRIGSITAGVTQKVLAGALRTDLGAQVVQLEGRLNPIGVLAPDRVIVSVRPLDGVQITRPERLELLPGTGGSIITILPGRPVTPERPDMVPGVIGSATKP